jgi:hypothetical protein
MPIVIYSPHSRFQLPQSYRSGFDATLVAKQLQKVGTAYVLGDGRTARRLLIGGCLGAKLAVMKRYGDDGWRMGASVPVGFGVRGYLSAPIKIGRTRAGFTVGRFVLALCLTAVWAGIVLDALQRHGL